MPIYEFYCHDCHTIFNFLSRRIDTTSRPKCPDCGKPKLERRMSVFSISKGRTEESNGDLPDLDEAQLERAMESMAGELENVDEDDPKTMGRVMRKLYQATGLKMGDGMEEALARMEAGEDPDAIESELGDALEGEDPFSGGKPSLKNLRRQLPPRVDKTLHDL